VGHVVRADQDDGEVGAHLDGVLALRDEARGRGADHGETAQRDRAVQPLGEPGGEQRAGRLARQLDPVPGGRRVAQHRERERRRVVLRPVPAVAARRRRLRRADRAAGQLRLAEDRAHRDHAEQSHPATAVRDGDGDLAYPVDASHLAPPALVPGDFRG
jgi:hypothetical protein